MLLVAEINTDAKYYQKPMVLEPHGRDLELVAGEYFSEEELKKFLNRTPRMLVTNFSRKAGVNIETRSLVGVGFDSPDYLEAWRQEFERRGFYAEIVDEKRARLWENIRGSGLDRDIQDEVVYGLERLPDEAVDNIQKELAKIL